MYRVHERTQLCRCSRGRRHRPIPPGPHFVTVTHCHGNIIVSLQQLRVRHASAGAVHCVCGAVARANAMLDEACGIGAVARSLHLKPCLQRGAALPVPSGVLLRLRACAAGALYCVASLLLAL